MSLIDGAQAAARTVGALRRRGARTLSSGRPSSLRCATMLLEDREARSVDERRMNTTRPRALGESGRGGMERSAHQPGEEAVGRAERARLTLPMERATSRGQPCPRSAHQPGEEAVGRAERLAPVPHRAPQHAAQHVVAALVAGRRAVGDRERERADVVGHHAVRHVLAARVVRAHLGAGLGLGQTPAA